MNVKRLAVLFLGCLAILFLAANPANAASACSVSLLNVRVPPDLNAEGTTERAADIVISGAGCFVTNTTVFVEYGAVMSVPTTFGLADRHVYWDFSDATDSLSLDSITITRPTTPSGLVTKVEFHVNLGTVNPAAFIILENLRFDVTGTEGPASGPNVWQRVADGHPLNVFTARDDETSVTGPFDVGNVKKTVAAAAVFVGWGFENGVCPFPGGCGYPNKGATTGSLLQQAVWAFLTNPAWVTDFPFRRTLERSPNPADPNLIGPTDLILDVENIMSGVTVTLPDALVACSEGGPLATWTFARGSKTSTGGNLVGIYQTTQSTITNPTELAVFTTNGAPDPGCDVVSFFPLISVKIGNPSGLSADGTMEAYLRVAMGPADSTGQFPGDDVAPAGTVPRYLNSVSATGRPTRAILGDKNPEFQPYFFLNPTETVILYPYVTNAAGWQTGIEVGNTGLDMVPGAVPAGVFGNTGQDGKLDFYFFPNGAKPFHYTATHSDAGQIGLDAQDDLDAGGDYAITLSNILAAAGHPGTFTGYIIVVAHFNYGHGAGMVFSPSTGASFLPGLILGGNCTFNANKAPEPPPLDTGNNVTFGISQPPACASARQGDLTQLPERLVM